MTRDIIWLKCMRFQLDDVTGVLELKDAQDIADDMELCADYATSDLSVTSLKLGDSVMWNNPVVTVPPASGIT